MSTHDPAMTLYKNKYRIESARCPNWDYTSNGAYFITICTKNRQYFFGDVISGTMQLSAIGTIVAQEWQKTAHIRPHVQLDAWVVMPNHLHGIIIITNPVETSRNAPVETSRRDVSTGARLRSNSLGAIIGQFKSVCTKQIWAAGHVNFAWQTRFHDRIIRDDVTLEVIRAYIASNPQKWHLEASKHQALGL
jgi:putative transposase